MEQLELQDIPEAKKSIKDIDEVNAVVEDFLSLSSLHTQQQKG